MIWGGQPTAWSVVGLAVPRANTGPVLSFASPLQTSPLESSRRSDAELSRHVEEFVNNGGCVPPPDERNPAGNRGLGERTIHDRRRGCPVGGRDRLACQRPRFSRCDLHVRRGRFLWALAASQRNQTPGSQCLLERSEEARPPLRGGVKPAEGAQRLQPHFRFRGMPVAGRKP